MQMQLYKDYQPTAFDGKSNFLAHDSQAINDIQNYYVVMIRTRDSKLLDQSNFEVALEKLGGPSDLVQVHNFGHWACGHYDLLLVHDKKRTEAETILDQLADYPILDDMDYCQRVSDYACQLWQDISIKERLETIQEHNKHQTFDHVSIFAARHSEFPGYIDDMEFTGE